ncbi:MAG: MotA/TolQ/ExbB proton channel family protein [Deltaproteobacteria bacterium]|nr:MotA/TolQ/ExbB proton channel family protein [Deltaproteobacteria bacterium]
MLVAYFLDTFSGRSAPFMWIITAVLAFGLAVFAERAWVLVLSWRYDRAAVREAVRRGDGTAAAAAAGRGPLGDVLRAGAEAQGAEQAWDAMSAEAARAQAQAERRVQYLAAIGNIATMIGLLGNVVGIIIAFGSLGQATAEARAVHLSEGIATAMAATAYGLLVAIPALAAHAWLDQRARSYLADVEGFAGDLAASLRRSG